MSKEKINYVEQYFAALDLLAKALAGTDKSTVKAVLESFDDLADHSDKLHNLNSIRQNHDLFLTFWEEVQQAIKNESLEELQAIEAKVPPEGAQIFSKAISSAKSTIAERTIQKQENSEEKEDQNEDGELSSLQETRIKLAKELIDLPKSLQAEITRLVTVIEELSSLSLPADIDTFVAEHQSPLIDVQSIESSITTLDEAIFMLQQAEISPDLEKKVSTEHDKIKSLSERFESFRHQINTYLILREIVSSFANLLRVASNAEKMTEDTMEEVADSFSTIQAERKVLLDKVAFLKKGVEHSDKLLLEIQEGKYEESFYNLEKTITNNTTLLLEKKITELRNHYEKTSQKQELDAELARGFEDTTASPATLARRIQRLDEKLARFETFIDTDDYRVDSKDEYKRVDLEEIKGNVETKKKLLAVQAGANAIIPEINRLKTEAQAITSYSRLDELKQLQVQLATHQEVITSLEPITDAEFVSYRDSVVSLYADAKKQIAEAIAALEKSEHDRISSPQYKDQQQVKESIRAFFIQRGIPERKEGEPLSEYLNTIHQHIIRIGIATTWNSKLDEADSSEVKTANYESAPFRGPIKEFSLNASHFIYDARPDQRVKTYEAFFDQFFLYFDNDGEQKEVQEFSVLMKEKFKELSTWHNRSVVRRNNEAETGPEAALNGLKAIYQGGYTPEIKNLFKLRPEATESEKRFVEGIKFTMGIWSVLMLKRKQRIALWDKIDPKIKKYFNGPGSSDGIEYMLKKKYDCVPRYIGTDDQRRGFIEDIISDLQAEGLTLPEAQMAYHIGECYRIGGGQEAFADAAYKTDNRDEANKKGKNVTVQAQEGEPKSANIGLYIESAWGNKSRPDFVVPYKDFLVHGYTPYAIAAQYNHNLGEDISGFGDNRATLAELLAVKDGVDMIDWDSGSTNPDKTVYQAAAQSTQFLWPASKISAAKKPEHSLIVSVDSVPLQTLGPLDRENEFSRVAALFGFQGNLQRKLLKATDIVSRKPSLVQLETWGFHSESKPISGDRKQRIKTLFKDSRDYWINAYKNESRFPMDTMRMMQYIFSRDDTLTTHGGYVNDKIGGIIEKAKSVPLTDKKEWLNSTFTPWLQGYLTYDLLLRSNFFLFTPDFKNIPELATDGGAAQIYDTLNYSNYENYVAKTISTTPTLNVAQVMHIINQANQLASLLPEETEKIAKSGYKLYEDTSKDNELIAPEIRSKVGSRRGKIYLHPDLLRLAQEFGMGKGYHYNFATDGSDTLFWQLQRKEKHPPTQQYVIDRITLLLLLFDKNALNLRG